MTFLLLVFIQLGYSQVYYGNVLEIPENLDMTKIESFKTIKNKYGGLRFESFGVLDFKENKVIFIDSKPSSPLNSNYLQMNMTFQQNLLKNMSVFSDVCGELTILPQFYLINQKGDKVEIRYIPLSSLPLGVEKGGFFILNTQGKTFILSIEEDDFKIISELYR